MAAEMTAYVLEEYGDPDVFTRTTVDVPEPGPDEIRVEVAATSLNPVDYKIRRGDLAEIGPDLPATLHCDVAGVVDAVGDDVDAFDEGDEVYGMPGGAGRQGALADFVVGHAGTFAHAPEALPLEESAALPVVALTAWEMLADKTTVDIGDEVLVYGGTGGVGHVGVQLANWFGADVTATASSEEKRDLAAELGPTRRSTTPKRTSKPTSTSTPAGTGSTSCSIPSATSTSRRPSTRFARSEPS